MVYYWSPQGCEYTSVAGTNMRSYILQIEYCYSEWIGEPDTEEMQPYDWIGYDYKFIPFGSDQYDINPGLSNGDCWVCPAWMEIFPAIRSKYDEPFWSYLPLWRWQAICLPSKSLWESDKVWVAMGFRLGSLSRRILVSQVVHVSMSFHWHAKAYRVKQSYGAIGAVTTTTNYTMYACNVREENDDWCCAPNRIPSWLILANCSQ